MSKEVCWQLFDDSNGDYYLKEFYTGKSKEVPKRYTKQIEKLVRDKNKSRVKLCNCEMKLQEIIERILKGKKK